MARRAPSSDLRVAHGIVFVLLMACLFAVPVLRQWPWMWLAPLTAYFLLILSVPHLRRSLSWLHIGRVSVITVATTIVVMALAISTLVIFHATIQPDLHDFRAALRLEALGGVVMAGIVFTIVNATLEELVFRGILFDALHSQWGAWFTLVVTAALFGLGHLRGYPPGSGGAFLAALFGFVMGALRLWTGGLALPIVAHMGADATIYCILICSK